MQPNMSKLLGTIEKRKKWKEIVFWCREHISPDWTATRTVDSNKPLITHPEIIIEDPKLKTMFLLKFGEYML